MAHPSDVGSEDDTLLSCLLFSVSCPADVLRSSAFGLLTPIVCCCWWCCCCCIVSCTFVTANWSIPITLHDCCWWEFWLEDWRAPCCWPAPWPCGMFGSGLAVWRSSKRRNIPDCGYKILLSLWACSICISTQQRRKRQRMKTKIKKEKQKIIWYTASMHDGL